MEVIQRLPTTDAVSGWKEIPKRERGFSKSDPLEITAANLKAEILDNFDFFLFDCDGVIWKEDSITPIPGVPDTYNLLKEMGKEVYFVTNNAQLSRTQYASKFPRFGLDVPLGNIYSSGYATVKYIKNHIPAGKKVYACVDEGLAKELEANDIPYIGYGPDSDHIFPFRCTLDDIKSFKLDPDVKAVIAGVDPWLSNVKLFKAASYLVSNDCLYVATDEHEGVDVCPGYRMPAAGATSVAITNSARRKPEVIGKPNRHMFQIICQEHPGIDPRRTLMIGDTPDADMGFAHNNGLKSCLVLTGHTDRSQVDILKKLPEQKANLPDYIISSIGDIPDWVAGK